SCNSPLSFDQVTSTALTAGESSPYGRTAVNTVSLGISPPVCRRPPATLPVGASPNRRRNASVGPGRQPRPIPDKGAPVHHHTFGGGSGETRPDHPTVPRYPGTSNRCGGTFSWFPAPAQPGLPIFSRTHPIGTGIPQGVSGPRYPPRSPT